MGCRWSALALVPALVSGPAVAQVSVRPGPVPAIVVAGRPTLMLGGELANSSASSPAYLHEHWPVLARAGLDTVLAPVSWQLIEPVEGRFDFATVDALLAEARAAHMRLVLLWFGSFKNSMSSYVPAWVKRDPGRFPRVVAAGERQEILSAFAPANVQADARAFAALMAHLKAVDGARNTVLMVQVENEIGMLPTAREGGAAADAAFAGPVPAALTRYLAEHRATMVPALRALWEEHGARAEGSWAELFGTGPAGEEVFTAWTYAGYAEAVAAAGKRAYPLPFYLNVALNRPGAKPGEYPSGGPLPHLVDVWKAGAPSVDLIAPDIYFSDFGDIIERYRRADNPLFVPEANRAGRREGPAEAFLAIGQGAIGYSPFAIDAIDEPGAGRLAQAYGVLRQLEPVILARGSWPMVGLKAPVTFGGAVDDAPQMLVLGGYRAQVSFVDPWTPRAEQAIGEHGGLILQLGPEEYLVAGSGLTVTFSPVGPGPSKAGIESVWEGTYDEGVWHPGRLLNGDETHQGRHVRLPIDRFSIQRVRLYRY